MEEITYNIVVLGSCICFILLFMTSNLNTQTELADLESLGGSVNGIVCFSHDEIGLIKAPDM